eukprot:TRINITY_DN14514_c0_g3_i1.p1 TRINITY_DN14514_c0_g3~~TRINITY_DN14514_c0_g3_i1.p1  ORF type:complete len:198 (-),score=24.35 TRINITY_DN14514_c0_g3_i1:118-711(-)
MAEDVQKLPRVATPSTSSTSEAEDPGSLLKKLCLKRMVAPPMSLDTKTAAESRNLENRSHFLNQGVKSPAGNRAPSSSCRTIGQAIVKSMSTPTVGDLTCTGRRISRGSIGDRKAGVSWATSPKSAKCITPHGQTYEKHPRLFNFDRKERMEPTLKAIFEMVQKDMSPPVQKYGMIVIRWRLYTDTGRCMQRLHASS